MTTQGLFPARGSKDEVENGSIFMPKFDENGFMPVITVDAGSGDILMFAYMNDVALERTIESGEAHYWSRSRQELWHKGATSGHVQHVKSMRVDCDQDVLLMAVEQSGGACHVGYQSCFYRELCIDGSKELITVGAKVFDPGDVY